jgi:hypothetical protein
MARTLPRPVTMPWGNGQVVEEVSAHDPHKEAVIQLIEWDGGGQTLRFCQYWPDGRFQRQPMIGVEDLPALRTALRSNDRLFQLVRRLVDEP